MLRTLLPLGVLSLLFFWGIKSQIEEVSSGNILHLNMLQDPTSLDPRKSLGPSAFSILYQMYEGLTRITPESTSAPGMAQEVFISEDQRTYTFLLRDAHWSNQDPVTAYDFEYSWKESIRPDFFAPNAHLLYTIKNGEKVKMGKLGVEHFGVWAIDAKTLVVELERPNACFLEMLSFLAFFPVPKNVVERNSYWAKRDPPPSNGPFVCRTFEHNRKLVLKRNPYYWAKKEVIPDEVHILLIKDPLTAYNLYEVGELDLIGDPFCSIPVDSLTSLQKSDLLKKKELAFSTFITFNTDLFPFNNLHIRRAFSLAIDRESIVENITQNGEIAAATFLPPILSTSKRKFPVFNAQQARKEFQQGLKELQILSIGPLTYYYPASAVGDRIAQALQEDFRNILGVDVALQTIEGKSFFQMLQKRQYQFAQFSWMAMYNDPFAILERFRNKKNFRNYPGWKNPLFNSCLALAESETDTQIRLMHLNAAEELIFHDFPLTPLFHGNYVFMEQNGIEGFYVSPIGSPHLQWIHWNPKS